MDIIPELTYNLDTELNVYPDNINSEIGIKLNLCPKLKNNLINQILDDVEETSYIESKRKKIHLVITIDKSGSMYGYPINYAKKIINYLITKLLGKNDLISIISFNDTITTNVHCIEIKDNLEYIITELEMINANGSTNIPDAIIKSIEEINKSSLDYQKEILLLTDGMNTIGPSDTKSIISKIDCNNADWKQYNINTCGLGSNVDLNTLEYISSNTDGKISIIKDNSNLIKLFSSMIATILYQSSQIFISISSTKNDIDKFKIENDIEPIFKSEFKKKYKIDTMVIGESKDILFKLNTNSQDIEDYKIELELIDSMENYRKKYLININEGDNSININFNNDLPKIINNNVLIPFLELETSKILKQFSKTFKKSLIKGLIQKIKSYKIDDPRINSIITKLEKSINYNFNEVLTMSNQYAQRQVSSEAIYTSPAIRTVSSQMESNII
jgi:Mg-chelatase subunit ChlD